MWGILMDIFCGKLNGSFINLSFFGSCSPQSGWLVFMGEKYFQITTEIDAKICYSYDEISVENLCKTHSPVFKL